MLKIAVLAWHEGTTLQCIVDACQSGRIPGSVVVVISNNGTSGVLARARRSGIPVRHLSGATHPHPDALDTAIREVLIEAGANLVFLAGYMKRLGPATLAALRGRALKTHPALLPTFGGQGMFGDRVFKAVLAAGELESDVSVHLVDDQYDTGPVIRQMRVPVGMADSVASLKTRVQECEREVVVQTLAAIAAGELRLSAG